MLNKLVFENLKHRPIRSLLSITAIGVQVAMMLTLVGLSNGMLQDTALRNKGVGADILVKPPGSSIIGLTTNMTDKYLLFTRKQPHVKLATSALIVGTGGLNSVTGLTLPEFDVMSGGFHYLEGRPFQGKGEIIVDQYYAREHKYKVGDSMTALGASWKIVGIVAPGMLARVVVPLDVLQDLTANTGKVSTIYVKLDDPGKAQEVIAHMKSLAPDLPVYSMEEWVSLFNVNNVPMLREFIDVIIALGVLIGFLVVFLSMYTAVLERTREIGILKALGASPGFILNLLLRETALVAIVGAAVGIGFSYVSRWAIQTVAPGSLTQAIVPDWWPISAGIALGAALLGATYPGMKAARQDAIEALAYD